MCTSKCRRHTKPVATYITDEKASDKLMDYPISLGKVLKSNVIVVLKTWIDHCTPACVLATRFFDLMPPFKEHHISYSLPVSNSTKKLPACLKPLLSAV